MIKALLLLSVNLLAEHPKYSQIIMGSFRAFPYVILQKAPWPYSYKVSKTRTRNMLYFNLA